MTDHTVHSYDVELKELRESLRHMGELACEQLSLAMRALRESDAELAADVVDRDRELDDIESKISRGVMHLIAKRQPMAVDLREAIGALRICFNLERCGDLAKNIARRIPVLERAPRGNSLAGVERMAEMVLAQLRKVSEAYVLGDAKQAHEVWEFDQEIDDVYESLFREFLTYMMEDPRTISRLTHLLFVAKNLERLGDHCTNVAEVVYYVVLGEELEHPRPKGADARMAFVEPKKK